MEAPHRRGWLAGVCVVLLALAVPASLLAADPQPTGDTSAPTATTTTTTPATATTTSTTATTTTAPATTTVPPETTTTAPPPAAAPAFTASKSDASVSIVDGPSNSDFGYSPSSVSITAGDTVTWTNNGTTPVGHDVASSDFNSGTLHNGETYSRVFPTAGTFNYVCTIHPFMKGTVIVAAAPTTGGNGGQNSNGGGSPGTTTPTTTTPSGSGGTTPTDPTSESAAGTSPTAAGTGSTLPQTGLDLIGLGLAGGLLLAAGLRLRRAWG